jgi:inner membrane transporter RhtA
LGLAVAGVYFLTRIEIKNSLTGYLFAFANCALFMLYVSMGHSIASSGVISGADAIGSVMLIAMVTIIPIGIRDAAAVFFNPVLLAAAAGVGISSSVIPYVCDRPQVSLCCYPSSPPRPPPWELSFCDSFRRRRSLSGWR